ncbi:hypothetical protein B0H19DRAFT_1056212 [Mycena capillaripes]|nr:hypothetical protein B0H19DRAFT_1056212 [Mycena capillaripes]
MVKGNACRPSCAASAFPSSRNSNPSYLRLMAPVFNPLLDLLVRPRQILPAADCADASKSASPNFRPSQDTTRLAGLSVKLSNGQRTCCIRSEPPNTCRDTTWLAGLSVKLSNGQRTCCIRSEPPNTCRGSKLEARIIIRFFREAETAVRTPSDLDLTFFVFDLL